MRTIRPNLSSTNQYSNPIHPDAVSDNSTDSVADFRFQELDDEFIISASAAAKSLSPDSSNKLLELSKDISDFCSFNSDVSSELQRLASFLNVVKASNADRVEKGADEIGLGIPPNVTTEILEIVKPFVKLCVEILGSSSAPPEGKRGAVGKLRLLAKNRSDFREIIGESGAIQSLIPFLRSSDPRTQENAVTAVLNLSLEESNKKHITAAGAITPLVYALSAGTAIAKQNAALALLNLSMIEDNQNTIGVCGAIPPLVSLLVNGSSRGKKDALTTLYKLCSNPHNKERAVSAGAVTPLVALVADGEDGTAEKAMVVLSVLSEIEAGREAIVEEGGIPALLEAIEDGPATGAEFALITLLQLCSGSECNRVILVKEGAIPPLVALRHSASHRLKHKLSSSEIDRVAHSLITQQAVKPVQSTHLVALTAELQKLPHSQRHLEAESLPIPPCQSFDAELRRLFPPPEINAEAELPRSFLNILLLQNHVAFLHSQNSAKAGLPLSFFLH